MPDDASLQLAAPGIKPKALLFVLVMLPLVLVVGIPAWGSPGSLWRLLATGQGTTGTWTTAATAAFLLLLWLLLHAAMHRHRLDLDSERLRVGTSFYTRSVPLVELVLDKARVVQLDERTEYKPMLKINGYALPGFQSGHFRLHNRASAFVAITGGPKALWLPTTTGKGLLLQPQRPEALLARLRELARPMPPR